MVDDTALPTAVHDHTTKPGSQEAGQAGSDVVSEEDSSEVEKDDSDVEKQAVAEEQREDGSTA